MNSQLSEQENEVYVGLIICSIKLAAKDLELRFIRENIVVHNLNIFGCGRSRAFRGSLKITFEHKNLQHVYELSEIIGLARNKYRFGLASVFGDFVYAISAVDRTEMLNAIH